jgi:hypothetical protein
MKLLLIVSLVVCSTFGFASAQTPALNVRLVTDEAEAVLAILAKRKVNQPINDQDWQRLFKSDGYTRLKQREAAMQRSFDDADFKTFVLSEPLAERAPALEQTFEKWKRADITHAARLALDYLPAGAQIKAKIYPVIKPRENSFVFDTENDPAIFLYLDPQKTREQFENMLAHELHHIGYAGSCPRKEVGEDLDKLPAHVKKALTWTSAFGEGFAMLAAAGGPDVHPHAISNPEDRTRWDKDVANFNDDLKKVEKFLSDVLENKLTDEQIRQTGYSFFGTQQGPWYTVGWKMSVLIEKTYGRAKLIESFCDQRKLLFTYNQAAEKHNRTSRERLALWSNSVVNGLR